MSDNRATLTEKCIKDHQTKIWLPKKPNKSVLIDSWIDVKTRTSRKIRECIHLKVPKEKTKGYVSSRNVRLYPTIAQQATLQHWLDYCTCAYNIGIDAIEEFVAENKAINFYSIRGHIKDEINEAIQCSKAHYGNQRVTVHVLNQATAMACSNYKACKTNLGKRNIKSFKLRHLETDRPSRVMRIAKTMLVNGGICPSRLGKMEAFSKENGKYVPFLFKNITSDSIVKYDSVTDEYFLFVPEKREAVAIEDRRKIIALDPGFRTLLTGISEDESVTIGNNVMSKVKKYRAKLRMLSKVKNGKKRRKKIAREKQKISNQMDDAHWKVANYLTAKYDNIIIGDMSVASIVLKKSGLGGEFKNRIKVVRYATFRARLAHKCMSRCVNYRIVDESYTSRSCTKCGFLNQKSIEKTFDCSNCNISIDRDINGARNIYFKHLQ